MKIEGSKKKQDSATRFSFLQLTCCQQRCCFACSLPAFRSESKRNPITAWFARQRILVPRCAAFVSCSPGGTARPVLRFYLSLFLLGVELEKRSSDNSRKI